MHEKWIGILLILGVASLWFIYPMLFVSDSYYAAALPDDAYYYLEIAQNSAQTGQVSFDGYNQTNGIHYLWHFILSLIALFITDKFLFIKAAILTQVVIASSSAIVLNAELIRTFKPIVSLSFVVLFYHQFGRMLFFSGMETSLVFASMCFLIVTSLRFFQQDATLHSQYARELGLSLTLLVASRLEYGVFGLALLFSMGIYWMKYKSIRWRTVGLWVFAPVGIYLSLFFLLNWREFDHFQTISSSLKSSFPQIAPFRLIPDKWEEAVIGWWAILSIPGLGYFFWKSLKTNMPLAAFATLATLNMVNLGIALHFLSIVLFSKWGVGTWYFSGYYAYVIFYGSYLLNELSQTTFIRNTHLYAIFVFGLALFTGTMGLSFKNLHKNNWRHASYLTALWINDNLADNTILGMNDTGILGYFLDDRHTVVNLDGVANNFDYQARLNNNQFINYLCEQNITYYIANSAQYDNYPETEKRVIYGYSQLYEKSGGSFYVTSANEVYRSPVFQSRYENDFVLLWDIHFICTDNP